MVKDRLRDDTPVSAIEAKLLVPVHTVPAQNQAVWVAPRRRWRAWSRGSPAAGGSELQAKGPAHCASQRVLSGRTSEPVDGGRDAKRPLRSQTSGSTKRSGNLRPSRSG